MDNILQPFLKISEKEAITLTALEKKLGASKGVLSRAVTNNTDIQGKWFKKLVENYPQYNIEWLLTGQGEMLKSEKTEQPVAQDYGIPLIPLDALVGSANGSFAITRDDIKEYYNVPEFRHADFMIKVAGASMQPKYYGGDVVACKIVKDWTFFQWNRVYVLDTAQGAIIKRIKHGKDEKHLLIVSENENYEPFEIAKKDIYAVALVIGVIRLE